ncbi:hypothetical protein PoB_001348300 [Plakobranchus ocellatus]|uniref:Uncharacterized protein n=1 Tax=Plakobranchus ocellatus TaxID=259542 RepID=A0AAV3YXL5_9GAST|nr:hypothetical protein PoB_001348300 [Plakobranchus ocellatus]
MESTCSNAPVAQACAPRHCFVGFPSAAMGRGVVSDWCNYYGIHRGTSSTSLGQQRQQTASGLSDRGPRFVNIAAALALLLPLTENLQLSVRGGESMSATAAGLRYSKSEGRQTSSEEAQQTRLQQQQKPVAQANFNQMSKWDCLAATFNKGETFKAGSTPNFSVKQSPQELAKPVVIIYITKWLKVENLPVGISKSRAQHNNAR